MRKRILFLILTLCLLITMFPLSALATSDIQITLDGELLSQHDAYFDDNGRTMVPYTFLAELIEAERMETIQNGILIVLNESKNRAVRLTENSNRMENGVAALTGSGEEEPIVMDTVPTFKNEMLYIPLRYVLECFGYTVDWDNATQSISITSPESSTSSFDFELLSYMPQDENYMISPISLKLALAMAANGATGTTQQELLDVLEISELESYNTEVKAFIETMNNNEKVNFNVANSIWLNIDFYAGNLLADNPRFSDEFTTTIEQYYLGVANEITTETGKGLINSWIEEQTNEKIKDAVSDDTVTNSLAILVNTIYFKGDWANAFTAESTHDRTFTDRNDTEHSIPFMNDTDTYFYYSGEGFQMLAKPYKDYNVNMYFILPESDAPLTQSAFDTALEQMSREYVHFSVPKFKTEYTHDTLKEILHDMGVNDAFIGGVADFRNMIEGIPSEDDIFISNIMQKTFIEVDELGTEAAAVTVITGSISAYTPLPEPISFICDKPFIYIIRDDSTGTILFVGEYAFVK